MADQKTMKEIEQDKVTRIMETVNERAGYYRANPQRFVKEYLGINLRVFQQILIQAMMHYYFFMFIAARSLGKTFLVALFCCVRCILYPGTKIVVTAGTLKQATESLLKIQDELMPMSPLLCKEIKKVSIGQNDASIYFQNNSQIKAKTSTDNARGARANIIVCDEYRMIDEFVLNTVIKKFLGNPRQPNYLSKPEYKHLQERNHEIYMSSAQYQSSWAYRKLQAYVVNFFVDTKKYFVCGLPYQLSIKEGLLSRGQVEDEMSETDFNEMAYQMEMETMWLGDLNGSFFKLDEINSRRKIKKAFLPLKYYSDKIRVPEVKPMNKRILSIDVALMGSTKKKKNDASAIFINDLIQSDATSYQSNFVYAETFEGLTTDQLGLIIMRYYYHYKCTDIVLDTNGKTFAVLKQRN